MERENWKKRKSQITEAKKRDAKRKHDTFSTFLFSTFSRGLPKGGEPQGETGTILGRNIRKRKSPRK